MCWLAGLGVSVATPFDIVPSVVEMWLDRGLLADKDYLGFWANETLNARAAARFLDLNKHDVAKVAHGAPASVRFDGKIPKEVLDCLEKLRRFVVEALAADSVNAPVTDADLRKGRGMMASGCGGGRGAGVVWPPPKVSSKFPGMCLPNVAAEGRAWHPMKAS
jgi:hypothetical protein